MEPGASPEVKDGLVEEGENSWDPEDSHVEHGENGNDVRSERTFCANCQVRIGWTGPQGVSDFMQSMSESNQQLREENERWVVVRQNWGVKELRAG